MKKWVKVQEDISTASSLHKIAGIHPIVAEIMANRGIDNEKSMELFLNPSLTSLASPAMIPQLHDAACYILESITAGNKICIYGDYDVDGITSTTLLVETLSQLGAKVDYYLPKRMTEGYGLNKEAVTELASNGYQMIITVDCGISDDEIIHYGNSLGLEFIITDHHTPPQKLPPAKFIVNPKIDDKYTPFKNLAGVGVAFKLATQLFELSSSDKTSFQFLDLVALGTIADIVPLLDENRILVIEGLKVLNNSKRIGIKALQDVSGLKTNIEIRDISFGIAPRLNAAGRLKHAAIACELLLEKDSAKAYKIAKQLDQINKERQNIGASIQKDIMSLLSPEKVAEEKIILMASDRWHPGIIGIVASQLCKIYDRPAGLISIMDKCGRGSMRSLPGLDIFGSLTECSDLLTEFGGHKEAVGFEIAIDKIDDFITRYQKVFSEKTLAQDLAPVLEIDMELAAADINEKLAYELEKLAPFGQGNVRPIFSSKELSIIDYRKIGKELNHLRLTIAGENQTFDGIAFNMADKAEKILSKNNAEIAFNLDINRWNGNESLQLNVLDIKGIS